MGQKLKKLDCKGCFSHFFCIFHVIYLLLPLPYYQVFENCYWSFEIFVQNWPSTFKFMWFSAKFRLLHQHFLPSSVNLKFHPTPNPLQKNLTFWKVSGRKEDHPMMGVVTYFDWLIEWLIGCTNGWNQLPMAQLWVQISVYCIGTK